MMTIFAALKKFFASIFVVFVYISILTQNFKFQQEKQPNSSDF